MKISMLIIVISLILVNCKNSIEPPTSNEIVASKSVESIGSKLENNLNVTRDYEHGMNLAKINERPVFLLFTGFGIPNSRKLEKLIYEDKQIRKVLKEEYENIWLYCDDRTPSVSEKDKEDGINYLGQKWGKLEQAKFGSNTQPQIFILNSRGDLLNDGFGYESAKLELLQRLMKHI